MASILTTVGIVFSLASQAVGFFREVPPWEFLTGTRWAPILVPQSFGVLPLVAGTLLVSVLAGLVAIPIGLATAIFWQSTLRTRFAVSSNPLSRYSPEFPQSSTDTSH